MNYFLPALAGFLLLVQPQQCFAQKWNFAFAVGPSLTSLKGDAQFTSQHKSTVGFAAGLGAEYFLNKTLSVVANPAYERKGSVSEFRVNGSTSNPFGTVTVRNKFDYLTLPLMLRATVGHPVAFFLNAGPYLGYLLKQENTTPEDAPSLIKRDKATGTDFGISAGLGMRVKLGRQSALQFEMRKNQGLTNINASDEVPGTVKTDAVNLLVGFVFVSGKLPGQ